MTAERDHFQACGEQQASVAVDQINALAAEVAELRAWVARALGTGDSPGLFDYGEDYERSLHAGDDDAVRSTWSIAEPIIREGRALLAKGGGT